MNSVGPPTWAHRFLTAAVTMLLLVMGAATASADPQPGPTTITVEAQLKDDSRVVAIGTLEDRDGNPVPGAEVEGRLNGKTVTKENTDDDGAFRLTFALPESARDGEQQLVVFFGGQGRLDASRAATNLPAPNAPATESSSPAPDTSPTPSDTRLDVFLNVSIAPATVTAGGLVTIEGTLTDENDAPIPGARISVLFDDEESRDSRVQSDESGSFKTFAEVPPNRSSGASTLAVSFAGNDSFTPGSKQFDVTVVDRPVGEDTTPSASPTEPEAQESTSAMATAPASADTTDGSSEAAVDRSPLSWFYVALIVVGGAALLVAAGLAFRGMYGRRGQASTPDERDLDLLLEPDPESDGEEGAFLSEEFGEVDEEQPGDVDEDQPGDPEDTQEIPPPRRGPD